MTPAPLVDIFVRITLLLAASALLDRVLRRHASAATRHLLWSIAIAALLPLSLASLTLPGWELRIPVPRASVAPDIGADAAPPNGVAASNTAPRATSALVAAAPLAATRDATPRGPAVDGAVILYVLYGVGLLILLARLALEPLALARLTRESRDVTDPDWRRTLDDAVRQLGVTLPVRLLQSGTNVMPLTFGTRRPTILFPASAGAWTEERRRAVLLHELAHVARRDCLVQRLASLACALYWPHPGVWWAARRLRVERELACDDRVLAAGAPARDYAGHLLEIAHAFGPAPAPATAIGMARATQLEQRLLAVLDEARHRAGLGRGPRNLLIAASVAGCLPVAALRATLVPIEVAAEPGKQATSSRRAAAGGQDLSGTWELRPSDEPGRVQLDVRMGDGRHGRTVPLAQVEALTAGQISATTNGSVQFPIRREQGTFTIDGACRTGVCAGTYAFEPSPAFAEELQRRGIGRPAPQDQLALAIADVGTAYLDALDVAGYAKPDVRLLVKAAQHGVDFGYLKDMTSLGYRFGSLDPLIRLRDHGVDPTYLRGMAANGIKGLPAEELVRIRDHGVDPEYIQGLASVGFTGLSVDALVEARDHGIDPEYIRGMQAQGYKQTLVDLRRTRDHGVDPEYVRALAALDYTGLEIDELVTARDHGVDPAYVRDMAAHGYKGVPLDALIRMRDHGVDAEYVRRLRKRGLSNLSVDEIIRRRDRGES